MVGMIIGVVLGGLVSWVITYRYYKKSDSSPPDWAKPLINKLPAIAPSKEELLKLFQNEISEGTITPHAVFRHVACPNCNAPLEELTEKVMGDDYHTILDINCPHCGWNEWTEV